MKKWIALFLCCMLCLCSTALAGPRYPVQNAPVTDGAAVLTRETVEELTTYHKKLQKETDIRLHVATVDFLDGAAMDQYLQGLWQTWKLEDDDMLLLLAVGEDKFAIRAGEDIAPKLSDSLLKKLLSAHLEGPFLRRDYDGAIRALIPALNEEINKVFHADVALDGLFGTERTAEKNWSQWAEDLTGRMNERRSFATQPPKNKTVMDEDEDTGFSLGKVILTLFLLSVIFGNKARKRRMGCGCAPFSSILAALGLFKLWKKD